MSQLLHMLILLAALLSARQPQPSSRGKASQDLSRQHSQQARQEQKANSQATRVGSHKGTHKKHPSS